MEMKIRGSDQSVGRSCFYLTWRKWQLHLYRTAVAQKGVKDMLGNKIYYAVGYMMDSYQGQSEKKSRTRKKTSDLDLSSHGHCNKK